MIASALPLAQPGRFTISWSTALRSAVRWFAPTSPRVHATGAQLAEAVVRDLVETSPLEPEKVAALSAACPRIVRLVASLCDSLAANWMEALEMVARGGIARPAQ